MSPTSVFRAGATALITGGASGVGLAVAHLCASHRMNVIVLDWNKEALSSTQTSLSSAATHSSISTRALDVSSLSAWTELKASLDKENVSVDFLHLNAGVSGTVDWSDHAYWKGIMDVNFWGVVNGVNTFYEHFAGADKTSGSQRAVVITGQ